MDNKFFDDAWQNNDLISPDWCITPFDPCVEHNFDFSDNHQPHAIAQCQHNGYMPKQKCFAAIDSVDVTTNNQKVWLGNDVISSKENVLC